MKRAGWVAMLVAISVAGIAFAADEAAKPANQYLGAGKCKTCHNSAKKGAQYKSWSESKHANAFLVLATPKAAEIATAKGIKDAEKIQRFVAAVRAADAQLAKNPHELLSAT